MRRHKMKSNINEKFFYHIYPLGMCGAPKRNDFCSPKAECLNTLVGDLDRLRDLGVNGLYIGPLYESTSHGYDTVDYYFVDRRLGNNQDFARYVDECHKRGISVVVDAVFNHTGRDFFAFKDIQQNGCNSRYAGWYKNIRFDCSSPYGDSFTYDGWAGCMDLVKLDVDNPEVREHIFGAVTKWVQEFHIDGLRLDAADVLTPGFMDALNAHCMALKEDFWLMGEVVHGDYGNWVKEGRLHSVTNYQLYKGMWSSFNCGNMFEVAWSLNEEFGNGGKYRGMCLYNFLDNHDVNRLASTVSKQQYLYPLYAMLFTVPGVPSVFYSSEYGIRGARRGPSDAELRPVVPPFTQQYWDCSKPETDSQALYECIKKFARIRRENVALCRGDYEQVAVTNTSLAYRRRWHDQEVIVAFNQMDSEQVVKLPKQPGNWRDELTGEVFSGENLGNLRISECWCRILKKI